jgi:hypothetical protein
MGNDNKFIKGGSMADVVLSVTIPEAKVAKALEGFLKIYPKPEGSALSYKEWVREKVRQLIVRDIRRGLQMIKNEQSQIAVDDEVAV